MAKVQIDLTTLSGWNNLPDGEYDITVAAKAQGYTREIQSSPVTVTKGTPTPTITPYITFSSADSFTLGFDFGSGYWDGLMEYSTDTINWTEWEINGSDISAVNDGESYKVYLRGTGNTVVTASGEGAGSFLFDTEGTVDVIGNIETLLDYQTVVNGNHPAMADNCFIYLFYDSPITSCPELPATTLADDCYNSMFLGCESLTQTPALPATTLADRCYDGMFKGCTSLTTAPSLPATELEYYCYNEMFYGCTSLYVSDTQTVEAQYEWRIPANGVITGTDDYEQNNMFANCLGTRASDDLAGEVGQQYVYYTQNEPVGSN